MIVIYQGLPLPPSANKLYQPRKQGGLAKSAAYTGWRYDAGWLVKAKRLPQIRGRFIIIARVERTYPPRDLDNFWKPTLDMLQYAGAIQNDKFAEAELILWSAEKGSGMDLCLKSLEPANDELNNQDICRSDIRR